MPLTIDFKEVVVERISKDPAFGDAMFQGAIECLLEGDVATGKSMLRDYINGTIGFRALSAATGRHEKSLMRMLSAQGNPQAANIFNIIKEVQLQTGTKVTVQVN